MSKNENIQSARAEQRAINRRDSNRSTAPMDITKDPHYGYSHFDSINYSVRHLAGKVLTVVDATVADPQQRKATKDIVKEAFRHTLDQIQSGCFKYGVSGGCAATIEPLQEL